MRNVAGLWWARATVPRESWRKAALRRSYAIHAYVGANGAGKSLAMAHDTIPALRAGVPVLSTMRFYDFDDPHPCEGGRRCDLPEFHEGPNGVHPAPHPCYRPLRTWDDALSFHEGELDIDEVLGFASSRSSHIMPSEALRHINKMRHNDLLVRWTAPSWKRADVAVREVTVAVTECVGSFSVESFNDEGVLRRWRDRRLFEWSTYSMLDYDEWTSSKRDEAQVEVHQRFWRPGSLTESAYNTRDAVLALATADSSGVCSICGGRRSVPKCKGHDGDAVGVGPASAQREDDDAEAA